MRPFRLLAFLCATGLACADPLVVISVDGLDYRYLRDADRLGLRIPNLRRLMQHGEVTEGVVGVVPTVTWPSHTTMITGLTPAQHGILGNRRPASEGGDYYWDASLLKARTLWHAARDTGLKTAAITWPVTGGASIDFNLPERFSARSGGAMDLRSIEAAATPGLVEKIRAKYPSFAQEWMNDRTRALATIYLLQYEKPDLVLLHFVDLDSEAHDNGPFTREANAVLEYTDELIGQILASMPRNAVAAIVSDHGFERIDSTVDVNALLAEDKAPGKAEYGGGLLLVRDPAAAHWLRDPSRRQRYSIAREVPESEYLRFMPSWKGIAAAFESAEHTAFGPKANAAKRPHGEHGLWPGRKDYRSALVLWGPGIRPARKPEASMLEIAPRLARILGVALNAAPAAR